MLQQSKESAERKHKQEVAIILLMQFSNLGFPLVGHAS